MGSMVVVNNVKEQIDFSKMTQEQLSQIKFWTLSEGELLDYATYYRGRLPEDYWFFLNLPKSKNHEPCYRSMSISSSEISCGRKIDVHSGQA